MGRVKLTLSYLITITQSYSLARGRCLGAKNKNPNPFHLTEHHLILVELKKDI